MIINSIDIHIGGKARSLKFNQLSLEIYSKNIDWSNTKTSGIYATFYAGVYGGAYAKQDEIDFKFPDVVDWVDELYEKGQQEVIKTVCDLWADTFIYKTWIAEMSAGVRSILESEELKIKKKVKSTVNGSRSTNSLSGP